MPALYRKYRSGSFAEVVGQPQVTDILEASLRLGRTTHGYLFIGPRGVGKTSVARILAYAINDLDYSIEQTNIDIIEIDAASNTGVDNIRDLINKAQIAPAKAKKKVYIVDEVHMLSKSAFNALLKLLEEPPKHVVFILATTDESKIPATVISRMQKFIFRKIPTAAITKHLAKIAKQEHIEIDPEALEIIAECSHGGMRDAISLFDQFSSLTDANHRLSGATVRETLGLIPMEDLKNLHQSYQSSDIKAIVTILKNLKINNFDAPDIASQLADYLMAKVVEQPFLINLIERLLLVNKSSDTELALLVALGKDIALSFKLPVATPAIQASESEGLVALSLKTTPTVSAITPVPAELKIANPEPLEQRPFNSDDLLSQCQNNFKALFGLLKNASFDLKKNKLSIIVPNKFAKNRLDAPKLRIELSKALEAVGVIGLEVSTNLNLEVAKSKATIEAAKQVMGGGEEVSING